MAGTVIEYLKKYGDIPFREKPLNDVDSLALCQLSYLKFDGMVSDVRHNGPSVTLQEIAKRPDVEQLTEYYAKAMMTPAMKWFCRQSGKQKFTPKDLRGMEETARLKAADRNPYSWNMDYYPYPDGSGYEARFTACGICTLMKKLGLYDLTPALCHLDYTMSEAGGASRFVRQYTLASGGPYCDCGYQKLHS